MEAAPAVFPNSGASVPALVAAGEQHLEAFGEARLAGAIAADDEREAGARRECQGTFTVTLSIRLAATGTATLSDETGASRTVSAVKAGASYIFENVQFPAPVSARRVFRITNLRGNAAQFSGSAATPSPITAMVSLSGRTPIQMTGAQQTVGSLVKA